MPALAASIHASHDLAYPDMVGQKAIQQGYDGKPLAICLCCGRYGQQRILLLRQPCGGRAPEASTGFKALQRLAQGLHPRDVGKTAAKALLQGQPAPPQAAAARSQAAPTRSKTSLARGAPGGRLEQLRLRVLCKLDAKRQLP